MATKITEMDEAVNVTSDDIFMVVNDPDGLPTNKQISVENLFANVSVNTHVQGTLSSGNNVVFTSGNVTTSNLHITYDTTPISSSDLVTKGKIWFDDNYLYVATANNQIKRVALENF